MSALAIRTPDGRTHLIALERDSYRLGRSRGNELCYPDVMGVSREHLVLERKGANWIVRDLGSTNGIYVNGKRALEPYTLRPNDRVLVGQLELTYTEQKQAPAQQHTVVFVETDARPSEEANITSSVEGISQETGETAGPAHVKALIRAGRELATHLPLEDLFHLILNLSVEAVRAVRGVVMTLERGVLVERASKGAGFRISSHVRDEVMNGKRSLLVRDALSDAALAGRNSIVQDQVRSMLAVPLQTDDQVIGLIYVDSPGYIREFTKHDLNLLTVMANMAAVRIENARLAEIEQNEKLHAQELAHAALIQRSILPAAEQAFPERGDFRLHAMMAPAREVGGDFFDYFLLDPLHLAFVVGDVSGKGVPAALYMAVSRTLLRTAAQLRGDPGDCLTYVNTALAEQHRAGMFVTVLFAVLNTASGEVAFANAGHNPPYRVSPSGEVRAVRDKGGPFLGMLEGIEYQTARLRLEPGECMVVYTDGVTEAVTPDGTYFEESRLETYLGSTGLRDVAEIVSGLQEAVRTFAAGAPPADDVTVLALRYLGPGSGVT